MESPPSYEAAIKQPNAFGGRIGVSLKYSMDFITFHANASQDGELSSPSLILASQYQFGTWSGKSPSSSVERMVVETRLECKRITSRTK